MFFSCVKGKSTRRSNGKDEARVHPFLTYRQSARIDRLNLRGYAWFFDWLVVFRFSQIVEQVQLTGCARRVYQGGKSSPRCPTILLPREAD